MNIVTEISRLNMNKDLTLGENSCPHQSCLLLLTYRREFTRLIPEDTQSSRDLLPLSFPLQTLTFMLSSISPSEQLAKDLDTCTLLCSPC